MKNFDKYMAKVNNSKKRSYDELNIQFTQAKGRRGIYNFKDRMKEEHPDVDEKFTTRKRKLAIKINDAINSKEIDPFDAVLYIINFIKPQALKEVEEFIEKKLNPEDGLIDHSIENQGFSAQNDMEDEEDFLDKLN